MSIQTKNKQKTNIRRGGGEVICTPWAVYGISPDILFCIKYIIYYSVGCLCIYGYVCLLILLVISQQIKILIAEIDLLSFYSVNIIIVLYFV